MELKYEKTLPVMKRPIFPAKPLKSHDPQASLAAVIAAFELVGVRFCVTGSLPADDEVAGLFVRVIREASTNALHHGQAHTIWLSMDQTARSAHLSVENDGTVPAAVRERGGIAGIRRRVASAGGTLSINREPRLLCPRKIAFWKSIL